ncbi:MAG: hypothetical protein H6Q20_1504 [Bacteroidetes bacterium]|jgi:hypothetical protein|nr:hypothetical protein [Bacteroidota bacterium]
MQYLRRFLPYFMLSGALAAFLYLYHVVAGGLLWPGYSHLMEPISNLTAAGAPDRDFLLLITNAYSAFALFFSLLFFAFYAYNYGKLVFLGALCLLILETISLAYGFFPEDLPGAVATFNGKMHIIVTMLIVPFTIISPLLLGLGFRKFEIWKKFAGYSVITSVLIVIFGSLSAIFYIGNLPFFGLVERLNIGSLQLWLTIFSLKIYKTV